MRYKSDNKQVEEAPPLTLGKMLSEYQRTWNYFSYFDGKGDERFQELDMEFVSALVKEYRMKVFGNEIIDPELSPDTIVPEKIMEIYHRCNEYCAKYMLKKKK